MDKTLEWVAFYEELATKILDYKDNSKELFLIIKELISQNANLEYLKIDENDFVHDPFSIIAILNRPITNEKNNDNANRLKLAINFAELFKIKSTVPTDFSMIPTIDTSNPIFHGTNECWKLFELAITCGSHSGNFTAGFYNAFDNAVAVKGNNFVNITLVLSLIKPNVYLNLSPVTKDFLLDNNLEEVLDIFPDLLKAGSPSSSSTPTSLQYISMCSKCNDLIEDNTYPFINFSQMTYHILNQDFTPQNFWWLNISPQTWNFVDTEIGERKNFNLINDQGNQRRIQQNFLDAQKYDMVIIYEATPIKKVIGLAKVVRGYSSKDKKDEEYITFEKTNELIRPIQYEVLKEYKELDEMEFFQHPHGSLFKLNQFEYDFIIDMTKDTPKLEKDVPVQEDVTETYIASEKILEKYSKTDFLKEVFMSGDNYDSIINALTFKKNIILHGVSGVGKTFLAKKLAYSLIGEIDMQRVEVTQFHQKYSYEDFLFGYKTTNTGVELSKGVFYDFCKKAQADPQNTYYFIIDELHRGNIDNIFGEVFTLIENDKRSPDHAIKLINRTNERFYIPENVYIIGIVNTCVSVSVFDLSLRRRFAYFEIQPGFETPQFIEYQLKVSNERYNRLILMIKELNYAIKHSNFHEHDHEHEHNHHHHDEQEYFQIGHSYFTPINHTVITNLWLDMLVRYELIPLIQEYWYDDIEFVNEWSQKLLNAIK